MKQRAEEHMDWPLTLWMLSQPLQTDKLIEQRFDEFSYVISEIKHIKEAVKHQNRSNIIVIIADFECQKFLLL